MSESTLEAAPRRWFGAFDPRGRTERLDAAFAALAAPVSAPRWIARDLRPSPFLRLGLRAIGADPAPLALETEAGVMVGEAALYASPDPRDAGPSPLPRLARLVEAGRLADVEGDYAAALHHSRARRLVLLRSRFGHMPLWFARRPDGLTLFATSPHCLLNGPGVSREPDPDACALFLAIRQPGPGRSYFADVEEVPPGATAAFTPDGADIRRAPPLAPDADLAGLRPGEILEEVRCRARTAILARAPDDGPAAMSLSGGLDSALIAAVLASRGPVAAACSVLGPDAAAGLPDERAHMRALQRRHPALRLIEIAAADADPLAPAAERWRLAASPNADVTRATALRLAEAAAETGATALLTGFGGDFALSSHGEAALFELLLHGRFGALGPEIARRRAAGGRLRNILIGGFVKPMPLYEAYRRLRPGKAALELPRRLREHPACRARLSAAGGALHERFHATVAAEEAAALACLPSWVALPFEPRGERRLAQRTPLLDARLLRAVLAAPTSLKLGRGPDGAWRNRALIRALLRPLAPAAIAERTDKELFQPDMARQLRAVLPRVREEARSFAGDPLWRNLTDPAAYRAALAVAETAPDRELLREANALLLPWFLGDFLRRAADRG